MRSEHYSNTGSHLFRPSTFRLWLQSSAFRLEHYIPFSRQTDQDHEALTCGIFFTSFHLIFEKERHLPDRGPVQLRLPFPAQEFAVSPSPTCASPRYVSLPPQHCSCCHGTWRFRFCSLFSAAAIHVFFSFGLFHVPENVRRSPQNQDVSLSYYRVNMEELYTAGACRCLKRVSYRYRYILNVILTKFALILSYIIYALVTTRAAFRNMVP